MNLRSFSRDFNAAALWAGLTAFVWYAFGAVPLHIAVSEQLSLSTAQTSSWIFIVWFSGAVSMLTIFVGLELMALSSYVLVGFNKTDRRSNEAAMKYFIAGAFGSAFLLYGISLFFGASGTTLLSEMGPALALKTGDHVTVTMALIMLSVGLAFKVAAVPFHAWAPDAYEGAPTPITAFISVASKSAAFAVLLRLLLTAFYDLRGDWVPLLWVLAAASMTFGNVVAILQSNTKRLLAYSSIAHAGYVLVAVVAAGDGSVWAVPAVLIYLLAYAFMNIGAFALITMLRRRDIVGDELKDFGGLGKRNPLAAAAMTLFMLSLGGIPPTAGFIGKFTIFAAVIESNSLLWLGIVAVLNSVVSLYYYFKIAHQMYFREPGESSLSLRYSPALVSCLAVALGITIFAGLMPNWMLGWVRNVIGS